jgi:DNA helicase HerA-like ATPase
MTLRGKKPEQIQKRLKALFYGCAGAGKTMASIQFPKPYLIDTERGAENKQYAEALKKQDGVIFQTSDFDEIINEVKALLTEKHDYKTLIIDPLTTVYNNMLDLNEQKVGSDFGRHYGETNKQMKRLLNLLLRLDMNVIVTSHAKIVYGDNLAKLGETFDCYKKLDYLFDLVIEIKKFGTKRTGVIRKSRIASLAELSEFDFSYSYLADKYGKDKIEKEVALEKLATEEQTKELNKYIELLKVPEETVNKWLAKAAASTLEEMETTVIQKCIDLLKKKIEEK